MAEGGDDYEMDDFDKEKEREKEREEEGEDIYETVLADRDQGQTSARDGITHVTKEETSRPNSSFSLDSGSRKHERDVTEVKKKFIMDTLGIRVNKGDGKKSSELLLGVKPVYSKKGGPLGLRFNNERIMKRKEGEKGKFVYNEGRSNREAVERFKKLLREVEEEHSKKVSGLLRRITTTPQPPRKS